METSTPEPSKLKDILRSKLNSQIIEVEESLSDVVVTISAESAKEFFQILKLDTELRFNLLLDITAVDWLDEKDERFEVVYHFLSLTNNFRIRVKIKVSEANPHVPTVSDLWSGANFLERETWDMYGIVFDGHPDLRRILMYDEFEGYPLRKDYPVQGKQPRIKLRAPEVENTATRMQRPELVSIGTNKR